MTARYLVFAGRILAGPDRWALKKAMLKALWMLDRMTPDMQGRIINRLEHDICREARDRRLAALRGK